MTIKITDPAIARQLERAGAKQLHLPQEIVVDAEVMKEVAKYRQPGDSDEQALRRAINAAQTGNATKMIN
jgi:hypothetical protein